MAAMATRWDLEVNAATDRELREFLAADGVSNEGSLSRFVEEAVKARIFELSVQQAKQENAKCSTEDVENAVDEAVNWARSR